MFRKLLKITTNFNSLTLDNAMRVILPFILSLLLLSWSCNKNEISVDSKDRCRPLPNQNQKAKYYYNKTGKLSHIVENVSWGDGISEPRWEGSTKSFYYKKGKLSQQKIYYYVALNSDDFSPRSTGLAEYSYEYFYDKNTLVKIVETRSDQSTIIEDRYLYNNSKELIGRERWSMQPEYQEEFRLDLAYEIETLNGNITGYVYRVNGDISSEYSFSYDNERNRYYGKFQFPYPDYPGWGWQWVIYHNENNVNSIYSDIPNRLDYNFLNISNSHGFIDAIIANDRTVTLNWDCKR